MEEKKNKDSVDIQKELKERSESVNIGTKATIVEGLLSLLNLASLIWIFHLSLTSNVQWWQLLIFIVITFAMFATVTVVEMLKITKAAEEMLNEQKNKFQSQKKSTKTKKQ